MQGRINHHFLFVFLFVLSVSLAPDLKAQSDPEDILNPSPKRLWKMLFQPSLKFSVPIGDGYTGMTGGLGFESTLLFATSRKFAIGFSVGKSGLRIKKDGISSGQIIKDDLSTSVWTFHALLAYYSYLNADLPGKGMTYTYLGLGAASHKASGELWVNDGSGLTVFRLENGPTRFSIPMGVGVQFGLSRDMMFNLSVGYTLVSLPKNEQETFSIFANSIFDIKAGLGFYIPRLDRY